MSGSLLPQISPLNMRQPIGFPLFATPDAGGRLHWPDLATSVRQRIEAILRTAPGEQLMHPEFGAGLETFLHQPNSSQLRATVHERVAEYLSIYEPRMIVDHLAVETSTDQRAIVVHLAYRLSATGVAAQISAQIPVGGA